MRPSVEAVPWRVVVLASLGGALEFYDFVVFGVFTPGIAASFFPAADPEVAQILALAGFAIGYFARPVGGIVLGHLGDRLGRQRVFVGSALVVSLVTLAMGMLPTYAQIGAAAPLLLLGLRLAQGFCLGGELPGAITYVVETVPRRASLVCGVMFACVNAGVLLATLVRLGVQEMLPADAAADWGWRFGFLLGGALGLVGFRLRRALIETPAFARLERTVARLPLREVLAAYPKPTLVGVATVAATAGFTGLFFVHMPGYLVRVLHHDPSDVAIAQNVAIAVTSFALVAVGWIGDRVPRQRLIAAGAALLLFGSWPCYRALASETAPLAALLVLAALGASLTAAVFATAVADLFPTRVRFSGVATCYNLSFTLFSGTAPLLATAATAITGLPAAPALVMAGCAALTLFGSLWIERHAGHIVAGEDASAPRLPDTAS
jgi:MFS family permease